MRRWLLLVLGACSYSPPSGATADDDGMPPDAEQSNAIDAMVPLTCPTTFESYGGTTFYRILNDTGPGRAWKASAQECAAEGAGIHLAVVDDVPEADVIAMHLQGNRQYWVGMVQRRGEHDKADDWFWITGAPGLDHWAMGQPNDGDDGPSPIVTAENDSDQFAVITGSGTLDDRKEDTMRPALCECDGKDVDASVVIP